MGLYTEHTWQLYSITYGTIANITKSTLKANRKMQELNFKGETTKATMVYLETKSVEVIGPRRVKVCDN